MMTREDLLHIQDEAYRAGMVISALIGFAVIIMARPGGAEGAGLFVLGLLGAGFGLASWVIPVWLIRRWGEKDL